MSDTIIVYILHIEYVTHTHKDIHGLCVAVCGCWKRLLEGFRFPGTGVTGGCEHKM